MKVTRRETLPIFSAAGVAAVAGTTGLSSLVGATSANAQSVADLMKPGPLGEHVKGDPNAPVTIIKYASMTCPHCREWHKESYPEIKAKYIDTGIAKLYFREFPFDPAAAAAFMLAHCSGEDKYFSMIDVLYEQQATWSRGEVLNELFNIAKLAGFNKESFNSCLKDQELYTNVVSIQKKAASEFEVNSTPTFFINGTKYSGNMSAEAMSEIIDSLV